MAIDPKTHAFPEPIYVTRPWMPPLERYVGKISLLWRNRWLTNKGAIFEEFHQRTAEFLGTPKVSLFCNGTLALEAAIGVLGLKREVITTPFTFPATVHALLRAGIRPVFADIEPETLSLDPASVRRLVTPRTSAILAVHVYGYPSKLDELQAIADEHRLRLVYDAAHAFGVQVHGKPIGQFGDMSMHSLHSTKVVHSVEGGVLVFKDPAWGPELDHWKNFGIDGPETVSAVGSNAKMNEFEAAMGILVLEAFEQIREERKRLTELYREILGGVPGLSFRPEVQGVRHNYHNFALFIDERGFGVSRDRVHEALKPYNIFTRKYFFPLCSSFRFLPEGSVPERLPVADRVSQEVLAFPLYNDLGEDEVRRICEILLSLRPGRS